MPTTSRASGCAFAEGTRCAVGTHERVTRAVRRWVVVGMLPFLSAFRVQSPLLGRCTQPPVSGKHRP